MIPQNPINYQTDHHILYCRIYNIVIFPSGLKRHLSIFRQQYTSLKQRQYLVWYYLALSNLIDRLEELFLPLDHSVPLPFLPIFKGFACYWLHCSKLSTKAAYIQLFSS